MGAYWSSAARICLEDTAETDDAFICEIPPGKSVKPQKHFFEELINIVEGRGATSVKSGLLELV